MVDPKTIDRELQPLLPNEIIRASAGTGKTFALSNRYLVLLASGVDCQSILATTFTKKGAGEILDRIVQRLSAAALSEDAATVLSQQLEFQINRQHASKVLHELLKNLHRLEISTLDSFFNRVAKAFSLELGLPPIWDLVDEQQIQVLRQEAVQSVLRTEELETLRHLMDKGESNRRVQALLMDTVLDLYNDFRESHWGAWDQLEDPTGRLTSTELETLFREVEEREAPKHKKNWDKFHDLILKERWDDVADSTFVQNVLDGNFTFSRSKIPDDALAIIQRLIKHCRCRIIERLRLRNLSTRQLLKSFGTEFEGAKDRLGQLYFDDIADRLKNFVQGETAEQFSFRLDHQIQHLMLDEFQDTSPTQWMILSPFARQVTRDGEPGRSFFCVGDMKQAIFGWRGGVAEIFDVVEDELANLAPPKQMVKSYRSSPVVINFVNQLFSNLERFKTGDDLLNESVHGWSQWFVDHETEKKDSPGHVTIEYAENCPEALAKSLSPSKASVRNDNVVASVVERVQALVKEMPEGCSVGVLARTNNDVGKIIFALQSAGVAASEEGGNPLTDSAAVEMVLSAFHLADHPGDDVARYHVSHGPLAGMFDVNPEGDSNRRENKKAVAAGAAGVRRSILEAGYGPTVEKMANLLAPRCTRRERLRLQGLVEMAYADPQDTQRWSLRPRKFVEFVREKKVSDATAAQVRVMTIHRSKGLEFDAVVMPIFTVGSIGLAGQSPKLVVDRDGPAEKAKMVTRYVSGKQQKFLPENFQEAFDDDDRRKIRESMCLLYVALTRAAHALHIIISCGEKYTDKDVSKTMGGVVLATMTDKPERVKGIVYAAEDGDERWFEKLPPAAHEIEGEQQQALLERYYLAARDSGGDNRVKTGVNSGRGINSLKPSSIGDHVSLDEVLGGNEDAKAMERGTLLHGCFECVQWLDEGAPDRELLSEHLEKIAAGSNLKSTAINEFYNAIKKGAFPKLLNFESYREHYLVPIVSGSGSSRMEVCNERRFAATHAGGDAGGGDDGVGDLIEGVVDRLILIYEGDRLVAADVIDFKSDAIGQHELKAKVAHYGPQLAAYRQAMGKVLGLPVSAISTRLAFISTGDVINLDMIEATVDPSTKLNTEPRATGGKVVGGEVAKAKPVRTKRIVDQPARPDEGSGKRIVDQRTDGSSAKSVEDVEAAKKTSEQPTEKASKKASKKTSEKATKQAGKAKGSKKPKSGSRTPKASPGQKTLWED